jgi:hypothetical protein
MLYHPPTIIQKGEPIMLSNEQLSRLDALETAMSQLLKAEQGSSRAEILKKKHYFEILTDCQDQLTTKPFRDCSNKLYQLIKDSRQNLHQVTEQKEWLEKDIKRLGLLIQAYNISIEFFPTHTTNQKNDYFEKNKYLLEKVLRPLMIRHQMFYSFIYPKTEYQKPLSDTYAQLRDLFFRNWIKNYFLAQGEVEKAFSYYWDKVNLKSEENWRDFFCTIERYVSWLHSQFKLKAAQQVPDLQALRELKTKEVKVIRASYYLFKSIEENRLKKLAAGEDRFKELAEKVNYYRSHMISTLSAHRCIIRSYHFEHQSAVKLQEVTSELQSTQEKLKKVSAALQLTQGELQRVSTTLQFTQEALDRARIMQTYYQPSVQEAHYHQPSVLDHDQFTLLAGTPKRKWDSSEPDHPHRFFTSTSRRDESTPLSPSLRPSFK